MRYIQSADLAPDMILAAPIYDKDNRIMLNTGRKISARTIRRIRELDIYGVYIEDKISSGITISPVVRPEIQQKIIDDLKNRNIDQLVVNAKHMVADILKNPDFMNSLLIVKDFDNYTFQHSVSVSILSSFLGIACHYSEEDLNNLAVAALLHDIGKTALPQELINKKGTLTPEEIDLLKAHPLNGYNMLKDSFSVLSVVRVSILEHHENEDGSGYPRGLMGHQIHRFAKIIHIADVYDAMISRRSYKPAIPPEDVLTHIFSQRGLMFDPFLVEVFIRGVPVYPKGVTVFLSNGEQAIVTCNYPGYPLRPDVRTFSGKNVSLLNDRDYLNVTITTTKY